ncbi:uncharacterized protein [Ptychodera flava]
MEKTMPETVVLCVIWNVMFIAVVKPTNGYSSTVEPCGTCQNGGICDPSLLTCVCPTSYGGPNCEDRTFDCTIDGCSNGGYCYETTGECMCVDPFYGFRCQLSRDPWNSPTEEEKNKRSMIVSVVFSIVVISAVCAVVIFINVKRLRERRQEREAEEEIRNAVQVDGPPRLRLPEGLQIHKPQCDIHREDSGCFGNQGGTWLISLSSLPKRKRSSKRGLRGICTSPAALQNSGRSSQVTTDLGRSPSGVTVQECSLVSLPPPYDQVIDSDERETSMNTEGSGLFMRCPSTLSSEEQSRTESHVANSNTGESEGISINFLETNIDVEMNGIGNQTCNTSESTSRHSMNNCSSNL